MNVLDQPISYTWTLGWSGMSGKPIVNLLLKAIIDKNCPMIDALFAHGASLKACDAKTLQRVLWHVVDNYPIMSRLVANGLSRVGNDVNLSGDNGINEPFCLSISGHRWGLIGMAYHRKAYDVMNLLAANGFCDFKCGSRDIWYADSRILSTADEQGIKILLENGYILLDSKYESIILERSQVRRKSVGLDPNKFNTHMPLVSYEKEPILFGRAAAKTRNARRREDHEDRLRALNEFQKNFGIDRIQALWREEAEYRRKWGKLMQNSIVALSRRI